MGGDLHLEDSKPKPKADTFHEAIADFMRPPNQKSKPALPSFRRRGRRKEPIKKPEFKFNDDTFKDDLKDDRPCRFDGSLAGTINFKSPTIFCEVKLTEMLSKSTKPRGQPVTPGKYEYAPDAYRTSVCCQVPYFELVSGVESKNAAMVEEQERWKTMLADREADIANIEANMMVVKLEEQIEHSRADVFRARSNEEALDHEKSEYENLMAKHLLLISELQHCQTNLEVARREAAEGVPKKEVGALRAKIKDLEQKLVKADILTQQMGTMTPRPHWALLRGGHHYTMSTAEQAAEICKLNDLLLENVTTLRLECATAQLALAEAKQAKRTEKSPPETKGERPSSPKNT
ncbi:hypothetical protein R1sor_003083 [Riccia sorocarpa]|uniref:Uncharacterized protein n=1 Tax=Riccia sorocarpa TaxID=122646 RepID=A0ABD3H4R2_9MARC